MYVHRSNRMEGLVDELATVLRKPRLAVLAPETILIQSQGMERWLSRELAKRLGGFANARFPFPRAFIREGMDAVLGPAPQAALYEREVMTWAIAALFAEKAQEKAFAPVSGYLGEDDGGIRRLQLAERVAHLFDQYVIYRPKLVMDWEAGRGSDWQALLWRALVERFDKVELASAPPPSGPLPIAAPGPRAHFAARAAEFEKHFSPLFVERGVLPARLCVVGGASLPPLFLRLLARLAECSEVHLFCLAPTREYLAHASRGVDPLEWSGETSDVHPLLTSLGSVGAAFQQILESEVSYVDGAGEFVDPPGNTVLEALQSDLLNNRDRSQEREPGLLPRPVADGRDGSISLVSCHSPMREVEVLRDRLLALFDADPTLRPDDVVVMAPRIDAYVPLIEAVFSGDVRDAQAISFRVADRSERSVNPAAEGLLQLLHVLRGRLKASEVLDLLQCAPVRGRFGIEAADLPQVYRWVHDSGIRWGENAAQRREHGLPEEQANTWRFGLQRLFLGYALADDQHTRFEGMVPHDPAAADRVELLGRFARFCETLFECRALVSGQHSVAAWCAILRDVVEGVLQDEEIAAWQLRPLHSALHELEVSAQLAGFEEPLALEVMETQLAQRLEAEKSSTDFVAGGVTFCAMLPMRSIPFRVVCLLGMNDGEFPRVEQQLGFDKIAERPMVGDRSQRAEDRYLFLETILSARDRLIVSHVGRGIQDNQERPPTVVVAELSAAIEALLEPRQAGEPEYLAPAQHPLQPFSPRAFDGSDLRLASYAETYALGARALLDSQKPLAPLFPNEPLERSLELEDGEQLLALDELVTFFQNPARALLRNLGLQLDEDIKLVEDREPVESDALVRYLVGSRLMGAPEPERLEYELAELGRGVLPMGAPGRVTLEGISEVAAGLRRAAVHFTREGARQSLSLLLRLEGVSGDAARPCDVVGVLEGLFGLSAGSDLRLVSSTYARLSAKHELAAWVRHLAARASDAPVLETVLLGRGQDNSIVARRFGPVPRARAQSLLMDLVVLYRLGHRAPLPFFPKLSRAFAERVSKRPSGEDAERRALDAAERELNDSSEWTVSEGTDVYVQWAFRGRQPMRELIDTLDGSALGFAEVSRRVCDPLLEYLEELPQMGNEGFEP